MSTSIYINCAAKQIDESLLIAGASATDRYWLPQIHAMHLDLLEVAFGGGLTITKEYYPKVIEQVETLSAKLKELQSTMPEIDDAVSRCSDLLAWLRRYPPEADCELYIG